MYPEHGTEPVPCGDACGLLPSCAPLAVPYVPFQQTGAKRYNQADALNNGTLYPGLNLPFHIKTDGRNVVNGHLAELQALEFVLLELGLYLDTHQDDSEAFELYRQYDLFTSPEDAEREHRLQKAILEIKERFGKNAIVRGMDLQEGATAMERNIQIGGHRSGKQN